MISFTEKKDAAGPAEPTPAGQDRKTVNSFLDLILISRRGEPVGKRVELSRERFGEQLRALYRQLAPLSRRGGSGGARMRRTSSIRPRRTDTATAAAARKARPPRWFEPSRTYSL